MCLRTVTSEQHPQHHPTQAKSSRCVEDYRPANRVCYHSRTGQHNHCAKLNSYTSSCYSTQLCQYCGMVWLFPNLLTNSKLRAIQLFGFSKRDDSLFFAYQVQLINYTCNSYYWHYNFTTTFRRTNLLKLFPINLIHAYMF